VLGEHYSAADAHLFTIARWLPGDGVDPARQLPRVAAHMARMLERPAVKRALAAEGLSA
jgi:glutathione S-transferase